MCVCSFFEKIDSGASWRCHSDYTAITPGLEVFTFLFVPLCIYDKSQYKKSHGHSDLVPPQEKSTGNNFCVFFQKFVLHVHIHLSI